MSEDSAAIAFFSSMLHAVAHYLLVVFHVRQLSIERNVESRSPNSFVVRPIVVQLFEAVHCYRFKVQMEFVGKEFGAIGQQRQIADAKNAHLTDTFAVTRPPEWTVTPVLETSDKPVVVRVCFRLT